MRGRWATATAALVAVVVVVAGAVVGWRAWHDGGSPFAAGEECTAVVGGHHVVLDPEQARWAGLIVATSVTRGMPARAASIALATAYQESKLHNLRYGDRDSVGLFQQRPSQGWGSRDQLLDPVYATDAFYDALDRVEDYPSLPITEAAQEVQRSGFPTAYAAHEQDARALASALTGNSAHAFWCDLQDPDHRGSLAAVGRDVAAVFPAQAQRASTRELAVTTSDPARGWAVAQYLVSQAHRLNLTWVSYAGRTWHAGDPSADGWQPDAGASDRATVRVGVAG